MNIQKEPVVSVVMPSFNTGVYIGESIASVIGQTYANWELIIVDDCSNDDTKTVIESFNDNRIKFFQNDINSGAAISRNKAIREAKGKYITFLDSDDLWKTDKLKKQVTFMEDNGYAFTYTEYEQIDEHSQLLNIMISGPLHIRKKGFYLYNWVGCLTVMYDAELVGEIQSENLKKRNDYALWLEISKKFECHLLKESLGYYRKRSGSISNVGRRELVKSHYRLYRDGKKMNIALSVTLTMLNIIVYLYKTLVYKC